MSIFKGSGVALITPFKKDTNKEIVVDYERLEKLIEFHIQNGTDSIIICGTTGESSTLTEEEHEKCISECIKIVNGRIPVIAGTGSNNTKRAVDLSTKAEKMGADGLLCVTPYYNKTNQNGLKLYYHRIASSVNIPVIMYNVPSRTGVNIEAETAIEIAEENKNVIAIKEASGNLTQVEKITNSGALDVYSGNDDQIVDILDKGGIGVISVLANIYPQYTHDMVMEHLNGSKIKAHAMQKNVLKLCKGLFCDVNPIPVKKAMQYMDMDSGILREPLIELDDEKTNELINTIDSFGKSL